MPGGFWNDLDPAVKLGKEKPIHRRCVELSLQGFTNNEVAAQMGLTHAHVSQVLRQPYSRLYMQEAVKRTVKDEMTEFLDAELMPSLALLKAVRDDPTQAARDRILAAKELADRRLGRATQPITIDKPVTQLSKAELDQEVAAALGELNADRTPDSTTPGV